MRPIFFSSLLFCPSLSGFFGCTPSSLRVDQCCFPNIQLLLAQARVIGLEPSHCKGDEAFPGIPPKQAPVHLGFPLRPNKCPSPPEAESCPAKTPPGNSLAGPGLSFWIKLIVWNQLKTQKQRRRLSILYELKDGRDPTRRDESSALVRSRPSCQKRISCVRSLLVFVLFASETIVACKSPFQATTPILNSHTKRTETCRGRESVLANWTNTACEQLRSCLLLARTDCLIRLRMVHC